MCRRKHKVGQHDPSPLQAVARGTWDANSLYGETEEHWAVPRAVAGTESQPTSLHPSLSRNKQQWQKQLVSKFTDHSIDNDGTSTDKY